MRVRDVGTRHANHVDEARAHRMAGGRHVGDPAGMEDRQSQVFLEFAGTHEAGRKADLHARHIAGEPENRVDPSMVQVEEIDQPRGLVEQRDLQAFGTAETLLEPFAHGGSQSDDEVVADLAPDLLEHHQAEAATIRQRAAERVGPLVDR